MIYRIERFKREKFITIRGWDVLNEGRVFRLSWGEALQLVSILSAMLFGKLVTWRLVDGDQQCTFEPEKQPGQK